MMTQKQVKILFHTPWNFTVYTYIVKLTRGQFSQDTPDNNPHQASVAL